MCHAWEQKCTQIPKRLKEDHGSRAVAEDDRGTNLRSWSRSFWPLEIGYSSPASHFLSWSSFLSCFLVVSAVTRMLSLQHGKHEEGQGVVNSRCGYMLLMSAAWHVREQSETWGCAARHSLVRVLQIPAVGGLLATMGAHNVVKLAAGNLQGCAKGIWK